MEIKSVVEFLPAIFIDGDRIVLASTRM